MAIKQHNCLAPGVTFDCSTPTSASAGQAPPASRLQKYLRQSRTSPPAVSTSNPCVPLFCGLTRPGGGKSRRCGGIQLRLQNPLERLGRELLKHLAHFPFAGRDPCPIRSSRNRVHCLIQRLVKLIRQFALERFAV